MDTNQDQEIVKLDFPIKANGVEIDSLKIRRPKVRDMKNSAHGVSSAAEEEIKLVAILSENNPSELEDIDYRDWLKVQAVMKGFLS